MLLERAGLSLDDPAWPGASVSLADELLRPSVIYTPAVRAAIAASRSARGAGVHAVAHITGGGFEGNVPRALPDGLDAVVERGTWPVPAIFGEIRRLGEVTDDEMARVFNLGLGMVLVVDAGPGRRRPRGDHRHRGGGRGGGPGASGWARRRAGRAPTCGPARSETTGTDR